MPASVLILANPFSGTGPNRQRVGRLEAALRTHDLPVHTVWKSDERLTALRELEGGDHVVIAAGGDGSIADVVNDMNAADRLALPFATLPVGNENLFAQEFGFTKKVEPLAAAVARGQTRPMDLVRIRSMPPESPESAEPQEDGSAAGRDPRQADGRDAAEAAYARDADPAEDPRDTPPVDRLFTLMASSGFDAEVIHRLDRWRKSLSTGELHRVNRRSYAKRILGAIRDYRYPGVTLLADGREITGHQAYVFNLPRYGGGLAFAPDARADDQLLDWVVFERPGFVRLLGYHGLVMLGRHAKAKTVATGRAANISLRTANGQPVPTQADGDPAGSTGLDLTLLPEALNVISMDSA